MLKILFILSLILPTQSFAVKINDNISINFDGYSEIASNSIAAADSNKLSLFDKSAANIDINSRSISNAYVFTKNKLKFRGNWQANGINFNNYFVLVASTGTNSMNPKLAAVFGTSVSSPIFGTFGFRQHDLITSNLLDYNFTSISSNDRFDYGMGIPMDSNDRSGVFGKPMPSLYYMTPYLFNVVSIYVTGTTGGALGNSYSQSSRGALGVWEMSNDFKYKDKFFYNHHDYEGSGDYSVVATGIDQRFAIGDFQMKSNISYLYQTEEASVASQHNDEIEKDVNSESDDKVKDLVKNNFEKNTNELSIGAMMGYSDFISATFNYRVSNTVSPRFLFALYKDDNIRNKFANANLQIKEKMLSNTSHHMSTSINLSASGFSLTNSLYYGVNSFTAVDQDNAWELELKQLQTDAVAAAVAAAVTALNNDQKDTIRENVKQSFVIKDILAKVQATSFRYHIVGSYNVFDNAEDGKLSLLLSYYHASNSYFINEISNNVFSLGLMYDL